MVNIYKLYGPRERHYTAVSSESPTIQSAKDECDVNIILQRYMKNPDPDMLMVKPGSYADYSNATDFQTALNTVNDSEARFNELPSKVREKFSNDPYNLLLFLENPENHDEAVELGLIKSKATPAPTSQTLPTTKSEASGDDPKATLPPDPKD